MNSRLRRLKLERKSFLFQSKTRLSRFKLDSEDLLSLSLSLQIPTTANLAILVLVMGIIILAVRRVAQIGTNS